MFDPIEMVREFFEGLTAIDRAIVDRVAEEPCRDCGGPLFTGGTSRASPAAACGHLGRGVRPPLQPLLRPGRVPPPDHAPLGPIPGPTGVRRGRGGGGKRGGDDGDGRGRHRAGDGRPGAHDFSYGGNWHLPTFDQLAEWPFVSAGQLQTTPTAGTTCVLSFAVKIPDNGDDPGANEDFVWSSNLCNGFVHGGTVGLGCGTDTFCQGDLTTGRIPFISCPGNANAIALCVE
jgi:hypothetical protein